MRPLTNLAFAMLRSLLGLFRTRRDQAVVELALRQQLAVYARQHRRPRLTRLDRAFWVALSRLWPRWNSVLTIVRPETVTRWNRRRFRRFWQSISAPGPGRPPISAETRELIFQMAGENGWRARRIQAELSKLGIQVSLATVSRYLPRAGPDPRQQQRWTTFLRNHRDVIAGMDFFVVTTVRFQLLYVWFAIDHGRRQILHFNVTAHPTAVWVVQQLREAFSNEPQHRFLIFDNDAIFSAGVARSIEGLGLTELNYSLEMIGVVKRSIQPARWSWTGARSPPRLKFPTPFADTPEVVTPRIRILCGAAAVLVALAVSAHFWVAHHVPTGSLRISAEGAVLRVEPSNAAEAVRELRPGESLSTFQRQERWYRVKTENNERGWVYNASENPGN